MRRDFAGTVAANGQCECDQQLKFICDPETPHIHARLLKR
jgi:hypothetical protein